jgi:hypothetical protein
MYNEGTESHSAELARDKFNETVASEIPYRLCAEHQANMV